MIESASRAVLPVVCNPGNGVRHYGTGFKDAQNGYIVTAAHVVRLCAGNSNTDLEVGGVGGSGFISEFDPTRDLALVNSYGSNTPPALTIASTPASVGESLAVLGYPEERLTTSQATVTAVGQNATGTANSGYTETLADGIVVRGHIEDGDSGGPAINARGEVVGVVEIGTSDESTGYLTPASDISVEPAPP